jgi:hypothetical protein
MKIIVEMAITEESVADIGMPPGTTTEKAAEVIAKALREDLTKDIPKGATITVRIEP